MATKQISVFLENQPGKLAEFTACLSSQKVDLRAIALAEASDFGIARIIVDDVVGAVSVLREAKYICTVTDVITVEIKDEPGALADMIAILGSNKINIEYMYAITAAKSNVAQMVLRVNDIINAKSVLREKGIRVVE